MSRKYQLIYRDLETLQERSICRYRPRWMYVFAIALLICIMAFSFLLFNTVFSLWVNPFHYYNISKDKFNELTNTIRDLELHAKQNDEFVKLLQKVINGENVPNELLNPEANTLPKDSNTSNEYMTD